jgi:predicted dehydrogenase
VWTNRPVWPQSIEKRPADKQKVPAHLNWDLWLHPAPARPYHSTYVPFNWRGWWDFGTGALGDMGCHLIDFPYWALELGYPESVQASSTKVFEETAPLGSMVHYFFPSRYKMPPVHLTWYDGGMLPPQPKGLSSYQISDHHSGMIFEGREGTIVYKYVVDSPTLIVGGKEVNYPKPPQLVERSPGHYNEWIEASKGGKPASANFEYSGPLTEVVMLGNVAIRSGREMLQFDSVNLKIPNKPDAEKYL